MMAKMSKFWKGILWGALAGGAVSLLDRETRQAVKESCQKTSKNISYIIKNPDEIASQVKETATKLRTTIEEVNDDLFYIVDKVGEWGKASPNRKKAAKEANRDKIEETDDATQEK